MKKFSRYLRSQIEKDLVRKMVLVGGPRQVGKTTLATQVNNYEKKGYLNWDIAEDREKILKRQWPVAKLWVLDEIHKYRSWRNLLKGLYDKYKDTHQILVTGSARLDVYRFGGDSLQGRYHYLRLHPLSVAELKIDNQKDFLEFMNLGGFPEQYFQKNITESKRWSREYRTRLIQEDIGSLEQIQDLGNLELLMLRLPELVGSPLSINAIREDIQVSHKTVAHWLLILERMYSIFRLSPFGSPKVRAVKKMQKHYHYDWTLVQENSRRFENMVAVHLLKWVNYEQDTAGRNLDLRYFQDAEGREIDFVVTENNKPIMAIECKWQNRDFSKALSYFRRNFSACKVWQISAQEVEEYLTGDNIEVCSALAFLRALV